MTNKRIKNEQWYVKELISKINNDEINKPKFQRKRKWDILPKNENTPNEQSYIQFLFDTINSVHAITFGQITVNGKIKYSNIDGNNRINAIKHFIDKPFEIFPLYLDNLFKILDKLILGNSIKIEIKEIFKSISYTDIMNIKYTERYFKEIGKQELYNDYINVNGHNMEIEDEVENIQQKLKINKKDNFDINVKINVNLFEGYNTDELCKTFEDINKFNSKLTETELLACRLFNETDFKINDITFRTQIKDEIRKYYNNKAEGEVLNCYNYNMEKDEINAHDFIVSFQNLCHRKYNFIDKSGVDGLSLFFKLYKSLYGGFIDTFNTENINDFQEKILYSCEILKQVISSIFTDQINEKLFNNSCKKKNRNPKEK